MLSDSWLSVSRWLVYVPYKCKYLQLLIFYLKLLFLSWSLCSFGFMKEEHWLKIEILNFRRQTFSLLIVKTIDAISHSTLSEHLSTAIFLVSLAKFCNDVLISSVGVWSNWEGQTQTDWTVWSRKTI